MHLAGILKYFILFTSFPTHIAFPSDTGVMWLCAQQRADTVCVCFSFLLTNVSKSKRNLIQFLLLLLFGAFFLFFFFFLSKKAFAKPLATRTSSSTYTKIGLVPQKKVRLIVSTSSLSFL